METICKNQFAEMTTPTTNAMLSGFVKNPHSKIAAKNGVDPPPPLNTENYRQLDEYEYVHPLSKLNDPRMSGLGKKYKDFTPRSLSAPKTFVFLESKKVPGRQALYNVIDHSMLVFEAREDNMRAETDITKIIFYDGTHWRRFGELKCYKVDIDAYMQGILNLEFEDTPDNWGKNYFALNIRNLLNLHSEHKDTVDFLDSFVGNTKCSHDNNLTIKYDK